MNDYWSPAYIGIGSNLDRPERQVAAAFKCLEGLPDSRLVDCSGLYRSAPVGGVEQPDFVNAAASLLTRLRPGPLLAALQDVERRQGRKPGVVRWGPRVLDLDLLAYSGLCLEEENLVLPHPRIAERNFVLLPLREIAPDLVIPGIGRVATIPVNTEEPPIERLGST